MKKHLKSDIDILEQKLLLIKKQEVAQIDEIERELKQLGENGKEENSLDTTSYSMQFENLINSRTRLVKHLTQVNNALLRIKNNYYGNCAETGEPIPIERLLAVPTTTLSMEGKKLKEMKNRQNFQ